MDLEALAQRIAGILQVSSAKATVTGPGWDGNVTMEWETYNKGVSFRQLMEISTILGTTEFDVSYHKTDGYAISEVTWEPGTRYIGIRFQVDRIRH